jgi:non-heme chloroperoxidase
LSLIEQITEQLLKDPPSVEMKRLVFDELSRTPPLIKSAILFDCTFRDYRNVLPTINVPTLVCAGKDAKWRTVAAVKHVSELIPDARFELFEQSGHCLTVEEPKRFNQVLRKFVARAGQ